MSLDWIGSIVSINCGPTLGFYQGQVTAIDSSEQTVTIGQAFRNGIKSNIENITICASDIKDLQILKTREQAHDIVNKASTPSCLSKETMQSVLPKCPSPVKVVHACGAPKTGFLEGNKTNNSLDRNADTGTSPVVNPSQVTNGKHVRRALVQDGDSQGKTRQTPEREFRQRRNSASDSNRRTPDSKNRKVSTPKKMERSTKKGGQREDCFSAPAESFLTEFDFEKNLALFDKKAVFEEIENGIVSSEPPVERKPAKYRHNENVLPSQPTEIRQIRLPGTANKEFYTDSGLLVPSVSLELRNRIIEAAYQQGFTQERIIEMFGRSAAEMIMQLLGGSHRLTPANDHQRPTVVFLCGPHFQGALGVNCARQLSNHGTDVIVYAQVFQQTDQSLKNELKLLEFSSAKHVTKVKDLPSKAVDMMINALDTHGPNLLACQDWYNSASSWVQSRRAPCLAFDPSVDGSAFPSHWALGLVLPLYLPSSCGKQYLCDVGLPSGIFQKAGIEYSSPFCHKFYIALN